MTTLEQEILEIINQVIDGKYIGKLRVIYEDGIYELYIYFDRWYTPTILAYEGTEDEFKKFVKKEFKKNQYQKVKFWEINREIIPLDEEEFEEDED